MASLWKSLTRAASPESYRLGRLVDRRRREEPPGAAGLELVCDIDKTYLETEFESVIRMVRIAFEAAGAKVTVAGASEVLLAARWGDPAGRPRPLHFVSSSPPQLRAVLEEKLMIDGLDWSSDTFKDQAYNLKMRRVDMLKQHVAYKSLAILKLLVEAPASSRFVLLGDNAESDAFIYLGVALFASGRLSTQGYRTYLEAGGADPAMAAEVLEEGAKAAGHKVEALLIRNVPGYAFTAAAPLTDFVRVFDDYFHASLLLMALGVIEPDALWQIARSFHNQHGMGARQIVAHLDALIASGRAGEALTAEARKVKERFNLPPSAKGAAPAIEMVAYAPDLARFDRMQEGDILEALKGWTDKMRRAREARE